MDNKFGTEDINVIMMLLERADIKGREAQAYLIVMRKLEMLKKICPIDLEEHKKRSKIEIKDKTEGKE